MSKSLTTYSAKSLAGTLTHPFIGSIDLSAMSERGWAQISFEMTTDRSVLQVASDGSVVPSVVPGDLGVIEIQVWQTSLIHQQLLDWFNQLKAASDAGDVSQWFGATVLMNNLVDGSSYYGTGVAPTKIPTKAYAEQAGKLTWRIVAANLVQQ